LLGIIVALSNGFNDPLRLLARAALSTVGCVLLDKHDIMISLFYAVVNPLRQVYRNFFGAASQPVKTRSLQIELLAFS
jgi:hypothetical protein